MSRFDNMFAASYGGVSLDILSMSDSEGRDLARFRYPHRKGVAAKDMGGQGRVTSATLIFFERVPGDDWWDRFVSLVALKDGGKPNTFLHPLTGSYSAVIGEFNWQAEPSTWNTVTVRISFIQSTPEPAVFEAGPGSPQLAAVETVNSGAADANAELAASGLSSTVPSATAAAVAGWINADIRSINHEVVKYANEIDALIQAESLATDASKYSVLVSLNRLRYQLQRAATTITQSSIRIMEHEVVYAIPLRVLAAEIYGAESADFRTDEIMRRNVVRNPARVEAGTRLVMSSPTGREMSAGVGERQIETWPRFEEEPPPPPSKPDPKHEFTPGPDDGPF